MLIHENKQSKNNNYKRNSKNDKKRKNREKEEKDVQEIEEPQQKQRRTVNDHGIQKGIYHTLTSTPNEKVLSSTSISGGKGNIDGLLVFFQDYENSAIKFLVNRVEIRNGILRGELARMFFSDVNHRNIDIDRFLDLPLLLKHLGLGDYPYDVQQCCKLFRYFERLKKITESELEADSGYISLKENLLFFDSHLQGKVFGLPKSHSDLGPEYEFLRLGKPDGVHLYFPCYLEIKGTSSHHLEGLKQGLERIMASINFYGLFAEHLVFVIEKEFAFVIDYHHECNSEIIIYQVEKRHICKIIFLVNEKVKNNEFRFYHRDTATLMKIFCQLNEQLFHNSMLVSRSQIRIFARSSSNLYQIVFNNSNKLSSTNKNSFIIKINPNSDRFVAERYVILLMDNYYHQSNEDYYFLGFWDSTSSSVQLLHRADYYRLPTSSSTKRNAVEQNTTRPKTKNKANTIQAFADQGHPITIASISSFAWFDGILFPPPSKYSSALIMEQGRSVFSLDRNVYHDLCQSLTNLHENRIIHRDLRSCNFLYFPTLEKYHIIDYDLSAIVPLGQMSISTTIDIVSAQAVAAPSRLKALIEEKKQEKEENGDDDNIIEVPWSFADDCWMLSEYFARKLVI